MKTNSRICRPCNLNRSSFPWAPFLCRMKWHIPAPLRCSNSLIIYINKIGRIWITSLRIWLKNLNKRLIWIQISHSNSTRNVSRWIMGCQSRCNHWTISVLSNSITKIKEPHCSRLPNSSNNNNFSSKEDEEQEEYLSSLKEFIRTLLRDINSSKYLSRKIIFRAMLRARLIRGSMLTQCLTTAIARATWDSRHSQTNNTNLIIERRMASS